MFSPVVDKTTHHAVRREYDIFFLVRCPHSTLTIDVQTWELGKQMLPSILFSVTHRQLFADSFIIKRAAQPTFNFCVCMYILNCSSKQNNQDFPWLFFFSWLTIWGFAPNRVLLISWKHMRKLSYVTAPPLSRNTVFKHASLHLPTFSSQLPK